MKMDIVMSIPTANKYSVSCMACAGEEKYTGTALYKPPPPPRPTRSLLRFAQKYQKIAD
jgi:hypothetical protein